MKTIVVNCHQNEYDVMVDRTTIFGNPFSHKAGTMAKYVVDSRNKAISLYRTYLISKLTFDPEFLAEFYKLKGKKLGCHCLPKSCHGQVIAEFLNQGWTPALKPFIYKS